MRIVFTVIAIFLALLGAFFEFFTIEFKTKPRIMRREKPNYLVGTISLLMAFLIFMWMIWAP